MNTANTKNIGKRFFAGLIDYSILFGILFAYLYLFGEPNQEGTGYEATGLKALFPYPAWFVLIILTESFFGATIGNTLMDLKPQSLTTRNGELTFSQSLKRHLLDPLDMFPFGIIGIITIKNTEKNQRLGDIWAKTIVVETKNK